MKSASPAYAFTQTRGELTIQLRLPEGTSARGVRCTVSASGDLAVDVAGAPLLRGVLHSRAELNTWTLDGGVLNIELDKAALKFWPRATVGGPEADVKALVEAEKREREPPYKASPGAAAPLTPARLPLSFTGSRQPPTTLPKPRPRPTATRQPALTRPPSRPRPRRAARRRPCSAAPRHRPRAAAEAQGGVPAARGRPGRQPARGDTPELHWRVAGLRLGRHPHRCPHPGAISRRPHRSARGGRAARGWLRSLRRSLRPLCSAHEHVRTDGCRPRRMHCQRGRGCHQSAWRVV